MAAADSWRLERDESVDLFFLWRSLGAQPPSLSELLTLPTWLIRDFQKLGARYYKAKERKRKFKEMTDAGTQSRRKQRS